MRGKKEKKEKKKKRKRSHDRSCASSITMIRFRLYRNRRMYSLVMLRRSLLIRTSLISLEKDSSQHWNSRAKVRLIGHLKVDSGIAFQS